MMSEEFEPVAAIYEKGDYVFGKCVNELAWPAKVTKADRDRDLYTVKFIKSNSTATLQAECLFEFNEQIILEVLNSYEHNNKSPIKVKQAISACRKELENTRKKLEDKKDSPISNKEPKIKVEQHSVETQQSAPHAKSKKTKGLKKLSKKQQQPTPIRESKVESDLANQYVLENAGKAKIEPDAMLQQIDKRDDNNEVAYLSDDQYFEPLILNNPQEPINDPQQPINDPQEPIDTSPQPSEKVEENAYPNSLQDPQVPIHTAQKERNSEESKPMSESSPTNETQTIPPIILQEEVEAKISTEMEVEHSQAFQIFEAEDKEKHDIQHICAYLNKMTAYLSGREGGPLSKDEKLDLAMLLQSHRKFYYPQEMLEAMVGFVKAFDFKLKEERRNCIIEYVKVKERIETVCFLRAQLCYDETTLKILDRYCLKQNLFS